jgi:hypothetical protein
MNVFDLQCDGLEWPCGNCSRRNERDLCNHPKRTEHVSEILQREIRQLQRKLAKMHDYQKSLTRAEQKAKALQHKITRLEYQLRLATDRLNQVPEFSASLACPNRHQLALFHDPTFSPTQHFSPAKTMHGQPMQHSSTGLESNRDQDDETDAVGTPLGQWQMWHMHGVLAANCQSCPIDEQSCQFTGRCSLAEETGPGFNFDRVAPLADIESNTPRLTLDHFTANVWDTSPMKSEGSTMQDQCPSMPRYARLDITTDQRPGFPTVGYPVPRNGDHLHSPSFTFPPVSVAGLRDFDQWFPPPPAC